MPYLVLFGICQKAIIDTQDGATSLIALASGLQMKIPHGEVIPADAHAPIPWAAVASWLRVTEDEEKKFQPKTEILFPSGKLAFSVEGKPFEMNQRMIQSMVNGFGFPIEEQGIYPIKLFLREVGSETWEEVSSFPFEIIHLEQKGTPDE